MSEDKPESHGHDLTWLVVVAGAALVTAGIVALFVVNEHDAAASTAMIMGSALLFGGVVLPDLSGDFELGPSGLKGKLDRLRKSTEKAESQLDEAADELQQQPGVEAPDAPPDLMSGVQLPDSFDETGERRINDILDEAAVSPTAALIRLAGELERELRALLAQTGTSVRRMSVGKMIATGEERNTLPTEVAESMRLFWSLRNDIVHGASRPKEAELLRAVDSGVTILKLLITLPRERHHVLQADLPVYSDLERTKLVEGWSALVLLSRQSELVQHQRVFLTRRTDYRAGQSVGYAFDLDSKIECVYLSDGTQVATLEFIADVLP